MRALCRPCAARLTSSSVWNAQALCCAVPARAQKERGVFQAHRHGPLLPGCCTGTAPSCLAVRPHGIVSGIRSSLSRCLPVPQKEHATFKRIGTDLFFEKTVSLVDALCGACCAALPQLVQLCVCTGSPAAAGPQPLGLGIPWWPPPPPCCCCHAPYSPVFSRFHAPPIQACTST